MGRSVAQFLLPGATAAKVLQIATSYAQEKRMIVDAAFPDHVELHLGSGWWTGRKLFTVAAWDGPQGAVVQIQAWVSAFMMADVNVNPAEFIGMIPRREGWRLSTEFVRRLGISQPEPLFHHG